MDNELAPKPSLTFYTVPWTAADVVFGLFPIVVLLGYSHWIYPNPASPANRIFSLTLSILPHAWMAFWPTFVAWRKGWRIPSFSGGWIKKDVKGALLTLCALPVASGIGLFVVTHLVKAEAPYPLAEEAAQASHGLFFFVFVMLAGASEEIFFRGLLFSAVRRWSNPLLAAVVSAGIFGYLHNSLGGSYAFIAGCLGLALAVSFQWRRSLLQPMLAHATWNGLAFVVATAAVALFAKAPVLGVSGDASKAGYLVEKVVPKGGAEAAGILKGDLITAIDGARVRSFSDIKNGLLFKNPGDKVTLEILRGTKVLKADVVLKGREDVSSLPAPPSPSNKP